MAKKKQVSISYDIGETQKCTRGSGGCFCIRSPIGFNMPPGSSRVINTGVRVSAPVQLFESRLLRERGVGLSDQNWTFDDGASLILRVENKCDTMVLVDEGDILAKFMVLDNSDFEEG